MTGARSLLQLHRWDRDLALSEEHGQGNEKEDRRLTSYLLLEGPRCWFYAQLILITSLPPFSRFSLW